MFDQVGHPRAGLFLSQGQPLFKKASSALRFFFSWMFSAVTLRQKRRPDGANHRLPLPAAARSIPTVGGSGSSTGPARAKAVPLRPGPTVSKPLLSIERQPVVISRREATRPFVSAPTSPTRLSLLGARPRPLCPPIWPSDRQLARESR